MVVTTTKIFNSIQWLITVFLVASFLLFDTYSWGKYSFVICAVLIYAMAVFKNRGRIRLRLEPFIIISLVFIAYTTVTAIWALSSTDTLTMARTLLRILLCYTLVYWSYMDDADPYRLLSVIVFASYVVAIYTVVIYGFDNILQSSDDILQGSTYANINSIALFLAFGVISDLYLILFRGFRIYSILSVLSIIIIASTRSRKAVVFLVLGVMFMLLFRYSKSKSFAYRFLKIVSIAAVSLVVIYILSRLPIFSFVEERLDLMINTLTGTGKSDSSTMMRSRLIELGIFCWSKKPFIGIGMANTYIVATRYLYFDAYLHNNYVELLAGGGIIAFILYYALYAYLIYGFIKLRKSDYQWFVFGIVMVGLLLITDYGRVSYYSKPVYFELMTLFLIIRIVNKNRKEINDNVEDLEVSV